MTALRAAPITRLTELAATANTEHAAACQAGYEALLHGIACGEALWEAKKTLPYGSWLAWLKENVEFKETTATSYMRVAEHKDSLLADGDVQSMQTALRALISSRLTTQSRFTPSEAREIGKHAKRHGINHAARHFNITYGRAWNYAHGRIPMSTHERVWRRTAAKDAKKRTDETKTVRKVLREATKGAAASELYAMAEKMQDVLGRAHAEAETPEIKAALARAGEHYRKMRDEVVVAVLAGGQ